MRIEEGEEIFEKRWNDWTKDELIEFLQALDGTEPVMPLIINWCLLYPMYVMNLTWRVRCHLS